MEIDPAPGSGVDLASLSSSSLLVQHVLEVIVPSVYTLNHAVYLFASPHTLVANSGLNALLSSGTVNAYGRTTFLSRPLPIDAGASEALRAARSETGVHISIIAPSESLLFMLPHLHDFAKEQLGVVVHVVVSHIGHVAAIRHTGAVILSSRSPQQIHDIGALAHVIAARARVPVIHAIIAHHEEAMTQSIQIAHFSIDVLRTIDLGGSSSGSSVASVLENIVSRTAYKPIEYYGSSTATCLVIALDTPQTSFLQNINSEDHGVILIRQLRPWPAALLLATLPKTIKAISIVDQSNDAGQGQTSWGPLYLDVLSTLHGNLETLPLLVSEILDHDLSESEAQAIFRSLHSTNPVSVITKSSSRVESSETVLNNTTTAQPDLDLALPYIKMLSQVFGDGLVVANGSGSTNVWGTTNSQSQITATSPEIGFGKLMATLQKRSAFAETVSRVLRDASVPLSQGLHSALSGWLSSQNDPKKSREFGEIAVRLLPLEVHQQGLLEQLWQQRSHFLRPSQWLIGGDAWAYDPGNSGVHHVIASKEKVNMIVLDTSVYSQTPTSTSFSSDRKKDLGLYAMNYGGVYVASIAVFASYSQALRAFLEADAYPGPSLIIAYAPDAREAATSSISGSKALAALKESKLAVDQGKWPLYRYDPSLGNGAFQLDSEKIRAELKTFLDRENQLSLLTSGAAPKLAPGVAPLSIEENLQQKHTSSVQQQAAASFGALLSGLKGDPILILYGSDGGHAEELARRVEAEGKRRNKDVRCMSLDEYDLGDLSSEQTLIVVISTAGQGEMPANAREFWKSISSSESRLPDLKFSVFGLGDSHYWPRPEDKHYFCKAGVDVHKRLVDLGATALLPCGLGDDQDLDGYETAFQVWWPQIWKLLTKEGEIVPEMTGPAAPTSRTPEEIKTSSSFLRGTIAAGLLDESTGALPEEDTVLTKFHGIYQQDDRDLREERRKLKQEKAFSFMVRVRVPGGLCTTSQWLQIDRVADQHANGTIRLTTRQAFQFHGILKRNLRQSIRDINQALMDTLAACGDVNRNVMLNPNPYQSAVHQEVYEFARHLSDHLSPRTSAYHEIWLSDNLVAGNAVQDVEPIYGPTYLPRKFKTAIAIPPSNDVDVLAHDLGYIAIVDDHGKLSGFNVTIGGGMGMTHNNTKTFPRLGDILGFCTIDQAVDVGEKVLTVQRDFGDRTNRKHARLKYTVEDNGIDWYRERVEERLGYKLQAPRPFAFTNNSDRYGWTEGVNGLWHYTFFIQNGRVKDTPDYPLKTALREIAKVHKGDYRLTANQNLIIGCVQPQDKPAMEALLLHYKIGVTRHSAIRLNSMACVALPTCGLAFAESERYLPDLVTRLEETLESVGLRDDAITIRMTGCPNGCARPYVAEIGFVGKAPGIYNLYLGGGHDGNRLNKLFKEAINEEQILSELRPLFVRYAEERLAGEKFGDFVIRIGVVRAVTAGNNFHT